MKESLRKQREAIIWKRGAKERRAMKRFKILNNRRTKSGI